MLDAIADERIIRLEDMMAEVWRAFAETDRQFAETGRQIAETDRRLELAYERTQRQMERTQRNLDQLSAEMREFKAEMREFKEEMRASRERSEADIKEMKKKWGELSNKMGTMAEDLVAPSIPRILRETVSCPDNLIDMAVRVRRHHPVSRREQEFDVVAVCGQHVLINETKSSLDVEAVKDFAQVMAVAREYFPEYADKKFVGAIGSLYVDESIVRYGEKLGLIVLGFGEDVMEVLNSPGFTPKAF